MSTVFHVCILYVILDINRWKKRSQMSNHNVITHIQYLFPYVCHNKNINLDKDIKQKLLNPSFIYVMKSHWKNKPVGE